MENVTAQDYDQEQTMIIADHCVDDLKRNYPFPIRACVLWKAQLSRVMENPAFDYWTEKDGKPRTDMPAEVDAILKLYSYVVHFNVGNQSFFIYKPL